ncbi:hypothetical protein HMI56_003113 [Coelomomyces lativittatus]|nr:hypothetical protein HMI56_003113 [Coelomomyces lativittatus]
MSIGQAHVSYYDKAHCQDAIDKLNNKIVDGLTIKLEHIKRPPGLQTTLSNMTFQNQQTGLAKGTSFINGGIPYPIRPMFVPPTSMFGTLGWSG